MGGSMDVGGRIQPSGWDGGCDGGRDGYLDAGRSRLRPRR